ncbi:MAG: hypothetical protein K2P35_09890 [Lachnospiraceae bacterium]|jgi:hypothetical protein|nr:hypothetical protein [Lachnospiraceae bacterium]
MMKMEVQMDEKKIEKSGEYSVEQINTMVSEVARKKGITKRNDEGLYIGNGDDKDFSNFGRIVLYLKDQDWFLPFVKTWILYADEETDDMATYFKKRMGKV